MDQGTTERLPRVSAPPLTSRVLADRYELLDEIGSGPLTRTSRAWDHQLHHIVAVKLLHHRFAGNQEVVDAFERAAKRAASLPAHRNIVSVHEVGREGDLVYLVMELIVGESVKELIDREGALRVDQAFDIGEQAALGLAFAHQYGLVHGNLRPHDILICCEGRVKVANVGIGRVARSTVDPLGRGLAPSPYRSPEEALGSEGTAASDVYALGVILIEMLGGTLPSDRGTLLIPARKQLLEGPTHQAPVHRVIAPAAAEIVLRALREDPHGRYRSATAFASALHQYRLFEAGATSPHLVVDRPAQRMDRSRARPVRSMVQPPSEDRRIVPVRRPRTGSAPSRPMTLARLAFLATILVACSGGWLAYHAVSRVARGWGQPAPAVQRQPVSASGCPGHQSGPFRLLRIWAETTQAPPGKALTVDYTIANDSQKCREVLVGLTASSVTKPGVTVRDPQDKTVVAALPGVRTYKRRFTFPVTAAGQCFAVLLSVRDPSGAHSYGVTRVNGLIAVTP